MTERLYKDGPANYKYKSQKEVTRYVCFSPACPPAGGIFAPHRQHRQPLYRLRPRQRGRTHPPQAPKAAGESYAAEVFLSGEREAAGIPFTIEGRADGIFTDEAGVTVIDEIKTTAVPADDIAEDMNPCHWAQGMVYGALYGRQQGLEKLDVRLTYYQIDTDDILRFVRHFTL